MRYGMMLVAIGLLTSPMAGYADDMAGTGTGSGPADKAYSEAMRAMMKDMHANPTGDADTDFVAMMLPHHQGAVDMAKVELQFGKDPMLRDLANSVIDAQEKEIAMMKAWQAQHQR